MKLPTQAEQQEYDKLELDFTLGCPGKHRIFHVVWDHSLLIFHVLTRTVEPCVAFVLWSVRTPLSVLAGTLDADCPVWDHVVQLFVCCEDADGGTDHCDKCDVTPWMSMTKGNSLYISTAQDRMSTSPS